MLMMGEQTSPSRQYYIYGSSSYSWGTSAYPNIYMFADSTASAKLTPNSGITESTETTSWGASKIIRSVPITYNRKPYTLTASVVTDQYGSIIFEYRIKNNDTVTHNIGFSTGYDTMVGGGDLAPFYAIGDNSGMYASYSSVQVSFYTNVLNGPTNWKADYCGNVYQIPETVFGSVTGTGQEAKNYAANTKIYSGDSGIALKWNKVTVEPESEAIFSYKIYIGAPSQPPQITQLGNQGVTQTLVPGQSISLTGKWKDADSSNVSLFYLFNGVETKFGNNLSNTTKNTEYAFPIGSTFTVPLGTPAGSYNLNVYAMDDTGIQSGVKSIPIIVPVQYTITEKHKNKSGTEDLIPAYLDTTTTLISGSNYSKVAPILPGYICTGGTVNGISIVVPVRGVGSQVTYTVTASSSNVASNNTVIFNYANDLNNDSIPDDEQTLKVDESYISTGETIIKAPDLKVNIPVGGNYSEAAPVILNHVCVGATINGSFVDATKDVTGKYNPFTAIISQVLQNATVEFKYTSDYNNDGIPDNMVTEKYKDKTGTGDLIPAQVDTMTPVNIGSNYLKTALNLLGKICIGGMVNSTPISVPARTSGSPITYMVTAEISNVTSNEVVIFNYANDINNDNIPDDEQTLKVDESYISTDGATLKPADTKANIAVGEGYSKVATITPSYVCIGATINETWVDAIKDEDGKYDEFTAIINQVFQNGTVEFKYASDYNNDRIPDNMIIEKYKDKTGTEDLIPLQVDTMTLVNVRDNYSKTAPNLQGKICIGAIVNDESISVPVRALGSPVEYTITAEILNVTSNEVVIFNYANDINNDAIPDDEQILTINETYVYLNGTTLEPAGTKTNIALGESYSQFASLILDYVCIGATINGTWVDATKDEDGKCDEFIAIINQVFQNGTVEFKYAKDTNHDKIPDYLLGMLKFYDISESLSFKSTTIGQGKQIIERNSFDLKVLDTKDIGSKWMVTVSIESPLTTTSGHTLPNSLVFIDNENNITPLNSSPLKVFEHTNDDYSEIIPVIWENDKGILLNVLLTDAYAYEEYTTILYFNLIEAP